MTMSRPIRESRYSSRLAFAPIHSRMAPATTSAMTVTSRRFRASTSSPNEPTIATITMGDVAMIIHNHSTDHAPKPTDQNSGMKKAPQLKRFRSWGSSPAPNPGSADSIPGSFSSAS